MNEQTSKPQLTVTFTAPDVITLGHVDIYRRAQAQYRQAQPEGEPIITLSLWFAGAIALLKAGVFKAEVKNASPEDAAKVAELIRTADHNSPRGIAEAIAMGVAGQMEHEIETPFSWSDYLKM